MKKDVVKIYIDPYYSEINNKQEGFELVFYGRTNNGTGKNHIITFKIPTGWVKYLISDFAKLFIKKRDDLNHNFDGIIINEENTES